jgi:hypothetical protein
MDANLYYRKVDFNSILNSEAYSLETNLDFNGLTFIAGYSHLAINNNESSAKRTLPAPLVGIGSWIGGSLRLLVTGKVAFYKDNIEYIGGIKRDSRHVNLFVNFYKLNSFTELSLGIGKELGYRFRRQKG